MSKVLHLTLIILCALLCAPSAGAIGTYYATVTVKSDNENGGTAEVKTGSNGWTSEATGSAFNIGSQSTISFTIRATAKDGYAFAGWLDEKNNVVYVDNEVSLTIATSIKSKPGQTKSFTAHFIPKPAATVSVSLPYGAPTISPETNKVGDTVTLSYTLPKLPRYGVKNVMVEFSHWKDEDGNIISRDNTCETVIKKETRFIAVLKDLSELPAVGKFYRVRNFNSRVLTLMGGYKFSMPSLGGKTVDPTLLRWALPTDYNPADFANINYSRTDVIDPITAEATPSTIYYVSEGSVNGNKLEKAVLKGQGADTKTLTSNNTLNIVPMSNSFYGYYGLQSSAIGSAGFKMTVNNNGCDVYLGTFGEEDPYSAMAIQPIDEAHMDYFWFGALPAEDMVYEGGYWTTMYTEFPYECRDGVEAYYINKFGTYGDIEYAEMMPVPGNVVPAKTAVLLKCKGLTTKENRLLPLDPAVYNIPELPDNMLRGEFQLYTNSKSEGRKAFSPETMRLLSVNADGRPSFIRMDATARGTAPEFIPANQAYIVFPSAQEAANHSDDLPIISQRGISGLDVIVTDADKEGDGIYYNVFGQPVANPVKGQIYIRNHKKIIF